MENKKLTDLLPQAVEIMKTYANQENIDFCAVSLGYQEEIEEQVKRIEKRELTNEKWEIEEYEIEVFDLIKKKNPKEKCEFVAEKTMENLLDFIKTHTLRWWQMVIEKRFEKQLQKIL